MLEAVPPRRYSRTPPLLGRELEAPTYRLEVVDRVQRRAGEEPLARSRSVILRPFL